MAKKKESAKVQAEGQLEQMKMEIDIRKLREEAEIKKLLMEQEFMYNMQLKGADVDNIKQRETDREDRKDERTRIQASQQSELIEQRNSGKPPKNFESIGNDILGGIDMSGFGPR